MCTLFCVCLITCIRVIQNIMESLDSASFLFVRSRPCDSDVFALSYCQRVFMIVRQNRKASAANLRAPWSLFGCVVDQRTMSFKDLVTDKGAIGISGLGRGIAEMQAHVRGCLPRKRAAARFVFSVCSD